MKKYVKPVFIVESYTFSESFASDCKYQVDPNVPITITRSTDLCANPGEDGHLLGGQNARKGNIVTNYFEGNINSETEVTLFNDGIESNCLFDWAGPNTVVYGPKSTTDMTRTNYGSFGQAFFGADPDEKGHAPAFNGAKLFS